MATWVAVGDDWTARSGRSRLDVPIPAAAVEDDLLIFKCIGTVTVNEGSSPGSAPSGMLNVAMGTRYATILTKIATASDASASTLRVNFTSSGNVSVAVEIWRGHDTADEFDVAPSASYVTSGTNPVDATSLTTDALFLAVLFGDDNSPGVTAVPSGFTETQLQETSPNITPPQTHASGHKERASVGTETIGAFTGSSGNNVCMTLVLKNADGTSGSTAHAISADLSGSGTLSGSISYAAAISSALSGTGTLSADLKRETPVSSSLSGSGSLSASVVRSAPISAGLAGSGALSASVSRTAIIAAALSGTGSLAADVMRSTPISAALDGSGSLSGSISRSTPIAAGLNATGSLTADVIAESPGGTALPISAALSGSGALSGDIKRSTAISAQLNGSGALQASLSQTHAVSASLTGRGTLQANVTTDGQEPVVPTSSSPGGGSIIDFRKRERDKREREKKDAEWDQQLKDLIEKAFQKISGDKPVTPEAEKIVTRAERKSIVRWVDNSAKFHGISLQLSEIEKLVKLYERQVLAERAEEEAIALLLMVV